MANYATTYRVAGLRVNPPRLKAHASNVKQEQFGAVGLRQDCRQTKQAAPASCIVACSAPSIEQEWH